MPAHRTSCSSARPSDGKYLCPVESCKSTFTKRYDVQRHLNSKLHNNVRLFACSFLGCKATFTQSSHLTVHEATHRQARAFQCDFCPKSFNDLGSKSRHERDLHSKNSFVCPITDCRKSYSTLRRFARHTEHFHSDSVGLRALRTPPSSSPCSTTPASYASEASSEVHFVAPKYSLSSSGSTELHCFTPTPTYSYDITTFPSLTPSPPPYAPPSIPSLFGLFPTFDAPARYDNLFTPELQVDPFCSPPNVSEAQVDLWLDEAHFAVDPLEPVNSYVKFDQMAAGFAGWLENQGVSTSEFVKMPEWDNYGDLSFGSTFEESELKFSHLVVPSWTL